MSRPIEIPFSSGYVNGGVFILFDLIAIWAVHRGLLALQGLHFYNLISRGKKVQLQRSRIPIVSGELLVQQTRWPHLLVIANLICLILTFFGTLGINGESKEMYVPVSLAYISRIRANSKIDYTDGNGRVRDRLRPRIFTLCRTSDRHSIQYWPGAFNVSENARLANLYNFLDGTGEEHHVNISTLSCQSNNSLLFPMLTVENCEPAESGCSAAINPRKANVTLLSRSATLPGFPKKWHNERVGVADHGLIAVYRTILSSTSHAIAAPGDRLVCYELSPRGSDLPVGEGRVNCFLFKWNVDSTEARIAFGRMFLSREDWKRFDNITIPLEITTATATIRWDYDQLGEKFFADGLRDLGVSRYSLTDVMDNAMSRAVTADIPSVKLYKGIEASITVVQMYAFVFLIVVGVCGLLLCCLKEIIPLILDKQEVGFRIALSANCYDTLSAMLRAEQERNGSCLGSEGFAELKTQNGLCGVGPLAEKNES